MRPRTPGATRARRGVPRRTGSAPAPGSADVGLFNLGSPYTYQPNLSAAAAVGGLWDTGSGTLTVSGSALTLNAATINGNAATGIEMDPNAGALTLSSSLVLGGAQQWINNSSSLLTASGGVANGGYLLTLAGSGNTTVSGGFSGSGGLTMNGSGTATLSGASINYTGATAVNSGTLFLSGATNFNSSVVNNAVLQVCPATA